MTATTPLPLWTLDAPYGTVERRAYNDELTAGQWNAYRAIWFYSAPRFSDLVDWPRVRDINAPLALEPVPPLCTHCETAEATIFTAPDADYDPTCQTCYSARWTACDHGSSIICRASVSDAIASSGVSPCAIAPSRSGYHARYFGTSGPSSMRAQTMV